MKKLFSYLPVAFALALGFSTAVFAQQKPCAAAVPCATHTAPEIDTALAVSGLALLGGAITVVRARRRK